MSPRRSLFFLSVFMGCMLLLLYVHLHTSNGLKNGWSSQDSPVLITGNRPFVIKEIITNQRHRIQETMADYNYNSIHNVRVQSLHDLLPELGGQAVKSVILTTWRSGSTFLGDVINSHPANFYHYEPLLDFNVVQIREEPLASEAIHNLKALFHCNYTSLGHYINYSKKNPWVFNHNTQLWSQCKMYGLCQDANFLSTFCQLFPFQSMKLVRLRLNLAEEILDDPSLNIRVVLLVRDPRGTMQSRKHHAWCRAGPDCSDPARHCSDMESDYNTAVRFSVKYPNTFRVIRYEDLSLNPHVEVKKLFHFLGLDFHANVRHYLDSHTRVSNGGQYGTYRNSSAVPFHWRQDLTHQEVQNIQQVCKIAMKHWGYVLAANNTHQLNFNPLGRFSLNK